MKGELRTVGLISLMTFVLMFLPGTVRGQSSDTLEGFRSLVKEAASTAASLKRCTGAMDRAVNLMVNDKSFAIRVFRAVQAGNSGNLQSLFHQRAPSCRVSVKELESDFRFQLVFGNPQTGNHFYLCFASRNDPKKCKDGTRADIEIVLQ